MWDGIYLPFHSTLDHPRVFAQSLVTYVILCLEYCCLSFGHFLLLFCPGVVNLFYPLVPFVPLVEAKL